MFSTWMTQFRGSSLVCGCDGSTIDRVSSGFHTAGSSQVVLRISTIQTCSILVQKIKVTLPYPTLPYPVLPTLFYPKDETT